MKTVLQINILNESGSTGRIMQGISNVIQENNMQSYTAFGYGTSKKSNSIRIGNKAIYYIHNICSRVFGNQGKYSYYATKLFLEKVDAFKPDIIHLHNIHGNYINYSLLFKYIKKNNIAVVWTLHDCWPFTGRCAYYQINHCEQWKNGCIRCKNTKDYPSSILRKNMEKQFRDKKKAFTQVPNLYLVTPSEWLKKEVEQSFLGQYPIKVINNGIDTSIFHFAPKNFKERNKLEKKFVILGVAHEWSKRKGLEDFVKLQKLLQEDEKIVLVGLSEEQIKMLPEEILGISRTESVEELVEIYSDSDVFVNFTYEDNFPTVNLEAMSCRLPVFTYNTGGSPEMTLSEDYVVECGNVNKMYEKVGQYKRLRNKNFVKKQCEEKIQSNYQDSTQFKKYLNIYNEVESTSDNIYT